VHAAAAVLCRASPSSARPPNLAQHGTVPAVAEGRAACGCTPSLACNRPCGPKRRPRDHGVPVADGDGDGDGEEVTADVGVGDGLGGAEVPDVREVVDEVLDGGGEVDESADARGEVDELPDTSEEDEFWVRVGGGVVGRGAGVRVSAGVVTTPTLVRAGFGSGRTTRYVIRVSRNMTLSSTVDVRTRW
jgi:hypothetical protein